MIKNHGQIKLIFLTYLMLMVSSKSV